jgi:hypothetical protein
LNGEEKPDFWPIFNQLLEEYKVVVAAAGIVVVTTTATPAAASELGDDAYKAVRAQKHELLVKYDSIWKDADEIRNDISRLERTSNPDNRALDALYRDLKEKKTKLRDIELDVRDLPGRSADIPLEISDSSRRFMTCEFKFKTTRQ